ncbi:MAG: NAD-glutamate dehydrogenase, partial [Thermoleophilaceae bacterium]
MVTRPTVEGIDEALIESVCSRLRERLQGEEAAGAEAFARQYYRWVAPEDMAEQSSLDAYGAALSHYQFACEREPGTTKIRLYNPHFETNGWQSTHTAIEIVADDMPFLVDSVSMELSRHGYGIHLFVHPVMQVRRDSNGRLLEVLPPHSEMAEDSVSESIIHVEVDRQTDSVRLEALKGQLLRVIAEVRAAVEDWPAMRRQALEIAASLDDEPTPMSQADVDEVKAFLTWLEDGHFTFLGYRDYELVTEEGELRLIDVEGSGLGILRQEGGKHSSRRFDRLPAGVRALALEPYLLNLTKANSRSTIHRAAYLDYVGVKRFDDSGRVIGERRFLGLYTHTAYHAQPDEIPILRRKVEAILARADFPPGSHNEKALVSILETHPRDELFQTPVGELFDIVMGILHLGERQRLRLFIRRDPFGRFLSCLVFVPRDRFNTENRRRIERILRDAFGAHAIDYTTRVSESVLVRLHYMVYTEPALVRDHDPREIELMLVAATRSWQDDLEAALTEEHGEEHGKELFYRYADAFPPGYRADWVARSALADIAHLESLTVPDGLSMSLYRPLETPAVVRAKLYRSGGALALSDMVPMFENMGVEVADERPYEITRHDGRLYWIYDFGLNYSGAKDQPTEELREAFQEGFIRIWHGDVENDGYNRLVLRGHLSWREITVLRAVARYLRQAGHTFSDSYVEQALMA